MVDEFVERIELPFGSLDARVYDRSGEYAGQIRYGDLHYS